MNANVAVQILIIDDEVLFAKTVRKRLMRSGFQCQTALSLAEANEYLNSQRPDLILLDMRLPDGSGLDFLHRLREGDCADIPVVILTAYSEIEDAVAAMKLQALDYLKKPIDLDELLITLEKALDREKQDQRLEHSRQREQMTAPKSILLGESSATQQVREHIERIGQLSTKADTVPPTVLIQGETGTGKDLAARCLHQASARRNRPFVHVDCAALPKELIETELFGHEKGAFTSASHARIGLIEAAEDGTVFLDEVGELPLELQAKLLAVLERKTLRRVGSSRERSIAAWFIAATNRNLEDSVATGEFRSDLYYRLNILTLQMPPLRQRGDDVITLARHFVEQVAHRYGLSATELSEDAITALRSYDWPGNVRELVNLIERAVILNGGGALSAASLMLERSASIQAQPAELIDLTLDEAESMLIRQALQRSNGNVSEAARQLGITRMVLRYRLQKYNITPER